MNWTPDTLRGEPWLDFLGYQSGHGDDQRTLAWIHSGPVAQTWTRQPTKPILNLEPPYEAHLAYQSRQPHSDYSVRRACYWSLLATPVAGLTYGGHGIWSWQTLAGRPKDHEGTGVAQPWRVAKDLPGAGQMTHLADLFTSLRWPELRPAQVWLADQPGGSDASRFVALCRTPDGRQGVAYLPVGGAIRLQQGALAAGAKAEWIDPRTGKSQPATSDKPGEFSAPDERDWLLAWRDDAK
ncbi:MAG: DUF4038 domain-containing protein [Pirellulaceae bacterium]|nr:DUF4038 domain-containing protein [Pirellulaceae bacterium]